MSSPPYVIAPDEDLTRRALAAWFRTGGIDQPSKASGVVRYGGLDYVVLVSTRGVLAVYRVNNDGWLRRLKRWPPALARTDSAKFRWTLSA